MLLTYYASLSLTVQGQRENKAINLYLVNSDLESQQTTLHYTLHVFLMFKVILKIIYLYCVQDWAACGLTAAQL